MFFFFFFFFQAEDGIRDRDVTGVQTCALPISEPGPDSDVQEPFHHDLACQRSEERRVGKGVDLGGRRIIKKKKKKKKKKIKKKKNKKKRKKKKKNSM